MLRLGGLMMLMLFVAQGRPAPGKVNSTYDKSANFQTLKTYSWVQGQPAFDPSVDKTIVAAVDSEMSALGFTKAAGRQQTLRSATWRSAAPASISRSSRRSKSPGATKQARTTPWDGS